MDLPVPSDARKGSLDLLREYGLVIGAPDQAFDLAALAASVCETPIALVTIADSGRLHFLSGLGVDARQTAFEHSFCAVAMQHRDLYIVADTGQVLRFAATPVAALDPEIRFYAGVPLSTSTGRTLGTLCVMDRVPRQLSEAQATALWALSRQVVTHLELRRQAQEIANSEERLWQVFRSCPVGMAIHRWSDRTFVEVNDSFTTLLGWTSEEVAGRTTQDLKIADPIDALSLRASLMAEGKARNVELAVTTRAGERRHVLVGAERDWERSRRHHRQLEPRVVARSTISRRSGKPATDDGSMS